MAREWWQTFFDPLIARVMFTPDRLKRTPLECDFMERALRIRPPAKLLDLACGIGRHAVEFARRGYEVTGIDATSGYLARARREAKRKRVQVQFAHSELLRIPFRETFDAAYSFYTSFGYYRRESDNLRAMRAIARALRPGGRVLIDTVNRDWFVVNRMKQLWYDYGDFILLENLDFDERRNRTLSTWIIAAGRVRKVYKHSEHIYDRRDLAALMRRAGLVPVRAFGNYKGEPLSPKRNRLVLVGQRPR